MKHHALFLTATLLLSLTTATAQKKGKKFTGLALSESAMVAAAHNFLRTLDGPARAKALFKLEDEERMNWHYIPRERKGLSMKVMTPVQRQMGWALITTGLSNEGFIKALNIMSLEKVLWELENQASHRDPEQYFISIFGKPARGGTWGWRLEGHHLSLNYTIVKGEIVSSTPSFLGANPGRVLKGPRKGLRALGREEDLGRRLFNSLDEEQKKVALIAEEAPRDIYTSGNRKADPLDPKGLPVSKMNNQQKVSLIRLVREYVQRNRGPLARAEMDKIQKMGHDKLTFAWAGSAKRGEGHYYRVQGPTFLLEYDNTQNGSNHPHAVWRSFKGDFGADVLMEHLKEAHKEPVKDPVKEEK